MRSFINIYIFPKKHHYLSLENSELTKMLLVPLRHKSINIYKSKGQNIITRFFDVSVAPKRIGQKPLQLGHYFPLLGI